MMLGCSASPSPLGPALAERQVAAVVSGNGSSNGVPARRRPKLSPKQRSALKQGKYMGTMRGLKPRQRWR